MAKPVTEKIGEQIKTIEEQTGLLKGLPEALVEINKPMIEYKKEGERLRGNEKKETHYVNLDRGINYDAIGKFSKVSVLHLLGRPEEWREARLAAGKKYNGWLRSRKELSKKEMRENQLRKKKSMCLIGGMLLVRI